MWRFFTRDGAEKAASGSIFDRGTSLPASPFDGQEYSLVVDATNGIVWRLKYNAGSASAFKWEFIGGSPLMADAHVYSIGEPTTSATPVDLATVQAITVPRNGDYIAHYGTLAVESANADVSMCLAIGATRLCEVTSRIAQAGSDITMSDKFRINNAVAGNVIKHQYWVGAGTGTFFARYFHLLPVRLS